jgi:3-oxoacyl-[acyl-carrier-protein] synthase II
VLGEGAGIVILQGSDSGADVPGHAWAELAGYGIAGDATHISRPGADGQVRAMTLALEDAALQASDIGYINAHGTATPIGDVVEMTSVKQAFGAAASRLALSSTKALHGHLMGAAGAVELIAAIMAMHTRTLPPTCHYSTPDPECDLDCVPNAARRCPALTAVMSNSFAFGGTNAALVATGVPGSRRTAMGHA